MSEFIEQLLKNSLVSVEMLDKMEKPYYESGEPILPGDRVLYGTMIRDDGSIRMVKFRESEIDKLYTIKDYKQYVPVLCKI